MSQLKVDSIVPSGGVPVGADGGGVIQVVRSVLGSTVTTTSTTYTTTGLSASITPRSSSNKILISVSGIVKNNYASGTLCSVYFTLYRGSTALGPDRLRYKTNTLDEHAPLSLTLLDSPATTLSRTYYLYFSTSITATRTGSAGNASLLDTAEMCLMEISA